MKCKVVLEIDNHWLKALAISAQFNKAELRKFVYEPVDNLSDVEIGKRILNFLKESKITPSPLIICLPRQQTTIRDLHLPSIDPQEIGNIIDLNISRQVPYPKEEIIYAYKNLGVEETGYSKVLLGIVHRNHLKHIFDILDRINLAPEKIELGSEGIISWLLSAKETLAKDNDPSLVIDIDAELTDLIIFHKDKLLFTRLLPLGREQLKDIPKRIQFLGDIKQSLVAFSKEEPGKKPKQIFLSGAVAELAELDSWLKQELGLALEAVEPCRSVTCDKNIKIPSSLSVSGIVGLGLETSRNILTFQFPEWQIRKEIKKRVRELVTIGSLAIYCLIAVLGIFLVRVASRQIYLDNLSGRFQDKEEEYRRLTKIDKKINTSRERTASQESVLNYIYYLRQVLPEEIKLNEIAFYANDKFILRGATHEVGQIFKFVSTLESSKKFSAVETKYTRKKIIKEKEVNEFEIDCRLGKK